MKKKSNSVTNLHVVPKTEEEFDIESPAISIKPVVHTPTRTIRKAPVRFADFGKKAANVTNKSSALKSSHVIKKSQIDFNTTAKEIDNSSQETATSGTFSTQSPREKICSSPVRTSNSGLNY